MDLPDTLSLANGDKAIPTFSAAEMDRRLDALRHHMVEEGIDVAVFTSMHNIHYFSDFLYCSFGRPYGLVVKPGSITSVSANIDYGQPYRRSYGGNIVYTDWQRDNFFRALQQEIRDGGRLGLEFDHLTVEQYRKFGQAFPGSELVDVCRGAMRLRMMKSDEEIDLIRNGAQVADIGGAACVEAISVGVSEHEVALHATAAMVNEIARRYPHSELRDTWTWFQSGLNTDGAHNPVTTRKLRRGDILSLNCFPMIQGYYTALERTLFLDSVTDAELRIWEVNCEVHRKGLQLIRPGVRCCDIATELNEIFARNDLLGCRTFGYGHSFGVLSHYYGREAGLEIREDIETVLAPGMVVSMEPMITIPQGQPGAGGYREHDILVVTDQGADNITQFPFGPEHNIVPA